MFNDRGSRIDDGTKNGGVSGERASRRASDAAKLYPFQN